MRQTPIFVGLALLALAVPAAPQAPKPAPLPAEERPAEPAPRLNLKLDLPASLYTQDVLPERAADKGASDSLPSLGGNATPMERPPASTSRSNSGFEYPRSYGP